MEPLPHAQAQIESTLKDICMSLKSEDWFDLEKPIVRTISVELPQTQRRQYREMEKQLFTEIQAHPIEAFSAGSKTMKLMQMASGAVYTGHADDDGPRQWVESHSAKLDALEEIQEEAAGESLLVGYAFKSDLVRILKRFPKAVHFSHAKGIIERWNAGKIQMLVAHAASMGHGVSLQHGGCRLVRFSTDWNSEQFDQMIERIGPVRQAQSGYKRNVFEYRIVAKGTIDEDIYDRHRSKRAVQDCLMDGMRRRGHAKN
jgi:SNF2 family DNA or RNA helicase